MKYDISQADSVLVITAEDSTGRRYVCIEEKHLPAIRAALNYCIEDGIFIGSRNNLLPDEAGKAALAALPPEPA